MIIPGKAAANVLFGFRVLLFLAVPLTYNLQLYESLPAAIGILFITWILTLLFGRTIWFPASGLTYLLQGAYCLAIGVTVWFSSWPAWLLFWIAPFLLAGFNSDAISNSRRWEILLPVSAVSWLVFIFMWPRLSPTPPGTLYNVPYPVWLYSLLPAVATLARLIFPRTKHLIHTSLDYRPVRVEILSFGMKRAVAVGIKKLTD